MMSRDVVRDPEVVRFCVAVAFPADEVQVTAVFGTPSLPVAVRGQVILVRVQSVANAMFRADFKRFVAVGSANSPPWVMQTRPLGNVDTVPSSASQVAVEARVNVTVSPREPENFPRDAFAMVAQFPADSA